MTTIGSVELVEATFSGFAFPPRRTQLSLLENEVGSSGNVVIQEASNPYREATVAALVQSLADRDLARGYEEGGDGVTFVDPDGAERTVLVFSFASTKRPGGLLWDVTLVLLELVAPAAEGS